MLKKIVFELKKYVLIGILYMILLVIVGVMIMVIFCVGGFFYNILDIWDVKYVESVSSIVRLLYDLDGFGGIVLGLMFFVIVVFIGFFIVDKLVIVLGFVGGMIVKDIGVGFLGVLVVGFIVGYICLFIKNYVKLLKLVVLIVLIFIVLVFGILIIVVLINYVIGIFFVILNIGLENWLNGLFGIN